MIRVHSRLCSYIATVHLRILTNDDHKSFYKASAHLQNEESNKLHQPPVKVDCGADCQQTAEQLHSNAMTILHISGTLAMASVHFISGHSHGSAALHEGAAAAGPRPGR